MDNLEQKLSEIIFSKKNLEDKVFELRNLKKSGVTQNEMKNALQVLRETYSHKEDEILEILDFVSGFCSNHMRIY